MPITNKMGLPRPLVEMASREYLVRDKVYSVTTLLKGVREVLLERRHRQEIERDVSDMIWMLFGTAVHDVLEQHTEGEDELKESRIQYPVGDYFLTGQFDLYNDKTRTVTDYKTASVWKLIFGDFTDWKRQLLCYCWLLRNIGFDANRGEIVALLKDHSKRDARNKAGYPQMPVQKVVFEFDEADFAECDEWIKERFAALQEGESLADDDLPVCLPAERWNSGDKYAVMKKGRKTALRVLDSRDDALAWMASNGGDEIVTRRGEDKKCADYCAAKDFCNYYRDNGGVESENE